MKNLNKTKILVAVALVGMASSISFAQSKRLVKKANEASVEFAKKASEGTVYKFKFDTVVVDNQSKKVNLKMKESFSYVPFRPDNTKKYHQMFQESLGRKFRNYSVSIESTGKEISDLIPNFYRDNSVKIDSSRFAKSSKVKIPLVRNASKAQVFAKGLSQRNVAMWQSHGWYYENTLDRWEWQRARDFLTVEDLWTTSFVVPFLTPMLENAGANVFLPRERDLQKHEVIVDADGSTKGSSYSESGSNFSAANEIGYGLKVPFLLDGENPFQMGMSRQMKAQKNEDSRIQYIPQLPESGEYAVYVSYARNDENVTDAHYTVYHSGGKTSFLVNQTMGGGTWIYLGTFRFEKGSNSEHGRVELTNLSNESGKWVSADAVKFGGGMGNIARGRTEDLNRLRKIRDEKGFAMDSALWVPYSSQRPKYQEAARYYLQAAGMPDSTVYSLNKVKIDYSNRGKDAALYAQRESGKEDYKDDYQSRGEWVNYMLGAPNGPNADPNAKGLSIPIDMAMAFHSDAGTIPDSSIVGTLLIYDTTHEPSTLPNGQSKWVSRDLADIVQTQVVDDIRKLYEPEWSRRGMWNKQYSESYRPKVPTILSEFLSHQNFADMYQANDPRFKFDVCRAYYKGILKFLSFQNGQKYVVQPLPVSNFQMKLEGSAIRLQWSPVQDVLEPTATPTSYRIYTRVENGGFDNGFLVADTTALIKDLTPGVIYSFKITSLNEGGESFPSEILACSLPKDGQKIALIVNGFDRICGPAAFDNGKEAGFLMSEDEGVAYHSDLAYIGEQYDFNRKSPWKDDDACGFGSSHADHETKVLAGNMFDYPFVHGQAFRANGLGFISMSDEAFAQQNWSKNTFAALDILFGEEKTSQRLYGLKKKDFSLFTPQMRKAIEAYVSVDGAKLFVSGAYVGTDLKLCGDSLAPKFAGEVLHYRLMTNHASRSGGVYPVHAMSEFFSTAYSFVQGYHPTIYKVESPDAIEPKGEGAKVLFRYITDNKTAGVCFSGKYQTVVLGFPFETITTEQERADLMGQILKFWGLK